MTARIYNVKDYGALGDGATDDTTAIQNALNAATAAGGGVVLVPPGTYLVTGLTLPSNIVVQGSGNPSTTIQLKNGSNRSVIKSTGFDSLTTTTPASLSGTTAWEIRDLLIDGNSTNQTGHSSGLEVFAYRYTLQNVEIYNCKTDGLYSEWYDNGAHTHGMESYVTNCRFISNGHNGVMWYGPHDSYFLMCFTIHNLNIGIEVATLSSGSTGGSTTFTQCHSWGFNQQYAWKFSTAGACVNCECDGPVVAGVWVSAGNQFTWIGGLIYNPGGGTAIGFKLGDASASTSVQGILIDTMWQHPTGGAIVFDYPSGGCNTIKGTILTNDTDRGSINFVTGTTQVTDQFQIITQGLSGGSIGAAAQSYHKLTGPLFVEGGNGLTGDSSAIIFQLSSNNSRKFWVTNFGQANFSFGRISGTPATLATSAMIAIGASSFSNVVGGFNANPNGTLLGFNPASTFNGDIINIQIANATTLNTAADCKFKVDYQGNLTVAGTINGTQRVLNVKDYGAKGDNSTDDTTAIQNALNDVASKGLPVFFPAGVYRISAKLQPTDGTVMLGVASGTYSLSSSYPYAWSSIIARKASMNDHVIFLADGVNRLCMRDLAIDGNKNNNTAGCGVYITDGAAGQECQSIIERCYIHDSPDSNIYLGHNRRGNKVTDCVLNYTANLDGVTVAGSDNYIQGCVIGSTARAGICVGTTITQNWAAASSPFAATVTHIFGCDIYQNVVGVAISQSSSQTVVQNCGIDRQTKQGITVYDGSANSIVGNNLHSNGTLTDNTYSHIDLGTNVGQVVIDGNVFGPLDSGVVNLASACINITSYGVTQVQGGGNAMDSTSAKSSTYSNTSANAPSAFRASLGGMTVQGNGSDIATFKNSSGTTITKVTNGGSFVHQGGDMQFSAGLKSTATNGTRITSGSGAPTTPGGANPTAGDFYFRTDTPSTANQRIYVCTVGGASPTWVGIV